MTSIPEGFCYVTDVIEDVALDIRYAGSYNFVGEPIDGYEAAQAVLTVPAAQALANAAAALREDGYRIVIYDAYRPQRAVDHFVRWAQDTGDTRMKNDFYPDLDKQALFPQGYIARRSGHSRGSTVDLSIVHMDGSAVDMGGTFDFFGPVSAHDASGLTREQRDNRAYLKKVMLENGFRAYAAEWWHYVLRDEPYPDTFFDFPITAPSQNE